jgi:TetR/AcrR family transcriptional regulator, fatty acid metabolism regulator protein
MRRQRSQPADQGRASRETILDGAFEAFTKGGYRDTAIDDIAAAAEISKGGIYFHFPTKESIFRELMRTTADKLIGKVEAAVASEPDPIRKAEVALATVLEVFAGHRTMARLFFEAGAGGRGFQAETNALHDRFARLIQSYLDQAIEQGAIPTIDTRVTSVVWFGALDEIVARWLQAQRPGRLEDAYPTLRALLLRSVGVTEETIAAGPAAEPLATFPEATQ